jgi:hypothetical protein
MSRIVTCVFCSVIKCFVIPSPIPEAPPYSRKISKAKIRSIRTRFHFFLPVTTMLLWDAILKVAQQFEIQIELIGPFCQHSFRSRLVSPFFFRVITPPCSAPHILKWIRGISGIMRLWRSSSIIWRLMKIVLRVGYVYSPMSDQDCLL